ncbi:MAG: RagB/SusD family nutrient uptake outer membrane protein [Muribaculaceae bacterium]|nr:RagB/SusD family nutrient uptake outer membrane protein [Muribaculaceae bacterium]
MKILSKIILLAAAGMMATSCVDLDLYPLETGSSDSWYKTEDEIKASIKGLYRVEFFPIESEGWSDDHQSRNRLNDMIGATLNGESYDVKTVWQNSYKAIARCNILLDKLADAGSIGISDNHARLYRSQVLFVKAVQYSILTMYFGDVVWVDSEITIDEAFMMGRTDCEEIMEHVYEMYDEAADGLPLTYGNDVELGTKAAALGCKARYALFHGDWEIAADAARQCLDLGSHRLYPDFGELFLASTHHACENIISWPYSLELNITTMSTGYVMGFTPRCRGGYASEYPSWDLFASFLCTDGKPIDESPLFDPHNPFRNRDPRCAYTIVEFGTEHCGVVYDPNPTVTQVYNSITDRMVTNLDCKAGSEYASYNGLLRKKGVDEDWINDNTFKVAFDRVFLRLAEVYLIYAEAMIEADRIDNSVLDAINTVRARAYKVDYTATSSYPAVTTTDRAELRRIVRAERRMELVYEGHRRLDLIRWRLAEKALNRPDYGLLDKDALVQNVVKANQWFWSDTPQIDEDGLADFTPMYQKGLCKIINQWQFDASKNYLWPIPSQEVITNPMLGQNDNY